MIRYLILSYGVLCYGLKWYVTALRGTVFYGIIQNNRKPQNKNSDVKLCEKIRKNHYDTKRK